MKKRILVFHTMVAPYRVDFFNRLWHDYDMTMCIDIKEDYALLYGNIENDYEFRYETFDTHGNISTIIKYVTRMLKRCKPEVVIVSECGIVSLLVVLYRIFAFKKYRIISIIDDSYDQLINKNHFSKKHSAAEKILVPRFDEVINVEPNVSEFFQREYGKGVYFPIIRDERKYRDVLVNSLENSNNYVKKYNLNEKKVILYVGRFVKIKNIERLIEAFNSIERDDIKLVLVGAGEEENSLRDLAGNDKILFTGKLTGNYLYGWYNVADIFVLPSLVEPFGAVTNEALMSGCKCIVSKAAGSACLIEDGVNGFKITPTDVNDIREKLLITINGVKKGGGAIVKDNLMRTTFESEFNKITKIL